MFQKPLGAKLPSEGEIENEIHAATKNYSSILVDAEANLIKIRYIDLIFINIKRYEFEIGNSPRR